MTRRAIEPALAVWHALALLATLIIALIIVRNAVVDLFRGTPPPDVLEREALRLPEGAEDVRRLGRGWHTFRLTVDGRPRRFLRHLSPDDAAEAFVELGGPVTPQNIAGETP